MKVPAYWANSIQIVLALAESCSLIEKEHLAGTFFGLLWAVNFVKGVGLGTPGLAPFSGRAVVPPR